MIPVNRSIECFNKYDEELEELGSYWWKNMIFPSFPFRKLKR